VWPEARKDPLAFGGDIKEQTRTILEIHKANLESMGSSLDKVVKVTVFLADVKTENAMNERSTLNISRRTHRHARRWECSFPIPPRAWRSNGSPVSLHLRLSEETRGFIEKREFEKMKPSAILLNTARGAIVNEQAMIEALSQCRIAGAGLDVFETEPLPSGHPLTRLENVVLTPHCAGVTPETLEAGLRLSIENLWSFLEGRPANVVVAAEGLD
jgi:hypothetical protein